MVKNLPRLIYTTKSGKTAMIITTTYSPKYGALINNTLIGFYNTESQAEKAISKNDV